MSKGRLYKARSCSAIARDRVVSDPNGRPAEPNGDNYVYLKLCKAPACAKGKGSGSSEVVLSAIGGSAQCPRQGVCATHMQDAAKCHLS